MDYGVPTVVPRFLPVEEEPGTEQNPNDGYTDQERDWEPEKRLIFVLRSRRR